jgi:hypothetical protein
MSIQPKGEDIRKAVKWISEQRLSNPEKKPDALVGEAGIKFDLSPKDVDFLGRLAREEETKGAL